MESSSGAAAAASSKPTDRAEPPFGKSRHVKYWLRCITARLPQHYISNESTRLLLGFFITSALEFLSPEGAAANEHEPNERSLLSVKDRDSTIQLLRALRHPAGGFRGSTNHICRLPARMPEFASPIDQMRHLSSPSLSATFFGLLILATIADEPDAGAGKARKPGTLRDDMGLAPADCFHGFNRRGTLRWLKGLQKGDGSFGEVLIDGCVRNGADMRYCYMAAGIRWILGPWDENDPADGADINVDSLVAYIRKGQSYDGGLGGRIDHESHAGHVYCGVAALALLKRPQDGTVVRLDEGEYGLRTVDLARHLCHRQFVYNDEIRWLEQYDGPDHGVFDDFHLDSWDTPEEGRQAAFGGRCNKFADTCYTWWATAALDILGFKDFVDPEAARRFLLVRTENKYLGGFGKHPGDVSDIYHSFLGLAALALFGKDSGDIRELDSVLCTSKKVVGKIVAGRRCLREAEADKTGFELSHQEPIVMPGATKISDDMMEALRNLMVESWAMPG